MKRWKRDLDPVMDYLINANSQGLTCQQVIIETFFGSNLDKGVGEPSICQTIPLVCCDLHDPTAFLFVNTPPPTTVKNATHSHLSKYTMDEREVALCDALEDWREAKVVTKLGSAHVMDISPGFILPSPMIDHIIDSAHHLKLQTINDLQKETHWSGAGLYGAEVLAIIHCIIPQPSDMPALMRMHVPACPALQPHPQVQVPASLDGSVASTSVSESLRMQSCMFTAP
ncbi:hypothetical protein EDC04DRAFT_2604828 [Pisolithus marmoratus]|nr:hypothetical protein EDC04DRAFT_2604828 [Pisolithus marmoratus]